MAPDLNSVPPSPRPLASTPHLSSRTTSRRASQQTAPPLPPLSSPTASLNILPSNQNAVSQTSPPSLTSSTMAIGTTGGNIGDNTGVGTGPGPLRHPRPLTAADLHMQLEKEQEAVVNRLTRELSLLRAAQNASVVSNTSSTSTGFPDPTDTNANHLLSGPNHPAPSQRRHHRSSSSTSTRSITAGNSGSSTVITGSMSSVFPTSAVDRNRIPSSQSLSRQNSATSSRRSGNNSPVPLTSGSAHGTLQQQDNFPHFYQQRPSMGQHREPSGGHVPTMSYERERERRDSLVTTGRYEETAYHRHELESVKRENELLKRRIRELERTLRERRQSDASRTRSESNSTTASVRDSVGDVGVGRGRERGNDGEEDGVRVGESARSGGLQ
ncbi:hypothetical protein B7494_g6082 [Chlorociboria aeruginascens]|nr:hypothetical protein B7494_g6082 [Chlorociboria aeruginascens]